MGLCWSTRIRLFIVYGVSFPLIINLTYQLRCGLVFPNVWPEEGASLLVTSLRFYTPYKCIQPQTNYQRTQTAIYRTMRYILCTWTYRPRSMAWLEARSAPSPGSIRATPSPLITALLSVDGPRHIRYSFVSLQWGIACSRKLWDEQRPLDQFKPLSH